MPTLKGCAIRGGVPGPKQSIPRKSVIKVSCNIKRAPERREGHSEIIQRRKGKIRSIEGKGGYQLDLGEGEK